MNLENTDKSTCVHKAVLRPPSLNFKKMGPTDLHDWRSTITRECLESAVLEVEYYPYTLFPFSFLTRKSLFVLLGLYGKGNSAWIRE